VNKQISAIESRTEIAVRESKVADELKSSLKTESVVIAKTTKEVTEELAQAKPVLEAAGVAVANIDPTQLTTLKSYA
jgi:phosphoglycerate dehydrogenase-like enzyme